MASSKVHPIGFVLRCMNSDAKLNEKSICLEISENPLRMRTGHFYEEMCQIGSGILQWYAPLCETAGIF